MVFRGFDPRSHQNNIYEIIICDSPSLAEIYLIIGLVKLCGKFSKNNNIVNNLASFVQKFQENKKYLIPILMAH